MKRAPVIRDEVASTETLEQGQRIITREVATSEAGLPPRCIPDRQKCEIEPAADRMEDCLDHPMRRLGETGITGKEAGHVGRLEQVHVRSAPPVVKAIAAAPMFGHCSMNRQLAKLQRITGVDRLRLLVTGSTEPLLHRPRCKDRDGLWQRSK